MDTNKISVTKAFTLAEVLITLTIIGVIAALTIPNLIAIHDAATLKSKFNKSYSTISNAISRMKTEYPGMYDELLDTAQNGGAGETGNKAASNLLRERLKNYFKVNEVKDTCPAFYQQGYKTNKNEATATDWGRHGYLVLQDGSYIFPQTDSRKYFYIFFDTNGQKKGPNKQGYDLFGLELDKDLNLINTFGRNCTTTGRFSGIDCTQKALLEPDYFKNLSK